MLKMLFLTLLNFYISISLISGQPLFFNGTQDNSTQSSAVIVDMTKTRKTCPTGYEEIQGTCTRTVYAPVEISCSRGVLNSNSTLCIVNVAKESECLPGYNRVDSLCMLNRTSVKIAVCPDDYLLRNNSTQCVKHEDLPPQEMCPPGSTAKGDVCVTYNSFSPTYVCPEGFILHVDTCVVEETYDCTPVRNGTTVVTTISTRRPRAPTSITVPTYTPINVITEGKESLLSNNSSTLSNLRLARLSSSLVPTSNVSKESGIGVNNTSPQSPPNQNNDATVQSFSVIRSSPSARLGNRPIIFRQLQKNETVLFDRNTQTTIVRSGTTEINQTEYIAASTCRRRRSFEAQLICSSGYLDDSNMCQVVLQVDSLIIPGGIGEIVQEAAFICPEGYVEDETDATICIVQEITQPIYSCPQGSELVEDRCIIELSPVVSCPQFYNHVNNQCVRTQITTPRVEYTVRYSCTGKTCGV